MYYKDEHSRTLFLEKKDKVIKKKKEKKNPISRNSEVAL